MPISMPVLDDRTFEQLLQEARERIPRYSPEWTNFNESDPGITLVQLHAWLAETLLYRMNRLPELNYLKFLELLNVQPRPAVAARAQLTFQLKKLTSPSDPLVVLIPKGTQVGVDDPDLEQELVFETDRTLTALNASLAVILAPTPGGDLFQAAEFNPDDGSAGIPNPFFPFGEAAEPGAVCYLGFLLRNQRKPGTFYQLDRFPAGELDLAAFIPQVQETDHNGEKILGPEAMQCLFPWQVTEQAQTIAWEYFLGTGSGQSFEEGAGSEAWGALKSLDETAGLARSGHIYLDVPPDVRLLGFDSLSRAFWVKASLQKPPETTDQLVQDLESGVLDPKLLKESAWNALGVADPDLEDVTVLVGQVKGAGELKFKAVTQKQWTDAGYSEPPVPYPLAWLRLRLLQTPEKPIQVSRFAINTVSATAAVTRVEELLGTSTGRPNQVFKLRRTPVLVDPLRYEPELSLLLRAPNRSGRPDEFETWTAVRDFYGQGPDSAVFRLDSQTGEIIFGDGLHGQIPVAGQQVIGRQYRVGGGAAGNVGPGTITKLKSALIDVSSVSNIRAAEGGQDAEPLSEVILRAPRDLRSRDRAVTADDFTDLARQSPGVPVHRAYALPETRLDTSKKPPEYQPDTPGAVTVVILPESKADRPTPTEEQLRMVCAHLDARRLITTELFVTGPRYHEISALNAEVLADRRADLKSIQDTARGRLLRYLHPLLGGEDGAGWPFGQDVYFGNVYSQLLGIPGVLSVLCLTMTGSGGHECSDVLPIGANDLFWLSGDRIDLKVKYDYTR
jgi:hypothetical protein